MSGAEPSQGKPAKRSPRRDATLVKAVDVAREAAQELAREGHVGDHLGCKSEGDLLLTHYFACLHPGYEGWAWAVTVARVPRGRKVTVCEVEMLPHDGALLAPEWVPWDQRLLPSDVARGQSVPYLTEDPRLVDTAQQTDADAKADRKVRISDRPRTMTKKALKQSRERWRKSLSTGRANRRFPQSCESCAFFVRISGRVGRDFGVCANEYASHDGSVVALDFSCGAHSETDLGHHESSWPIEPLRLNDMTMEVLDPAELWDEAE